MTNALGSGTVNVATNMPEVEARIHGRTAFELQVTRAELFREAILEWYERHRPGLAKRIEFIRRNHREINTALQLGVILLGTIFGTLDNARPVRFTRATKTAAVRRFEEA